MKLCSFRLTLKEIKCSNFPVNVYEEMKKKLLVNVDLEEIYKESDKTDLEQICPKESVIGYYKNEKYECFIVKLSKAVQSEQPIAFFLIVEEKGYEKAIIESQKKINMEIEDKNLSVVGKIEYIKLYLVDKDGIKNTQQRLKSFLKVSNIEKKDWVLGIINTIILVISILLMIIFWNKSDSFWRETFISSTISFFVSFIIFLLDILIRFRQLEMDFDEIWEPIQKAAKVELDADDSSVTTNSLNFDFSGARK